MNRQLGTTLWVIALLAIQALDYVGVVNDHVELVMTLVLSGIMLMHCAYLCKTTVVVASAEHSSAEYALTRESLAVETGYAYKWIFDLDKQFISPDRLMAKLVGQGWKTGHWYSIDELIGATPVAYRKQLKADFKKGLRALDFQPYLRFTHALQCADGELRWYQVFGKKTSSSSIIVGTSIDITDVVRAKEETQATLQRLNDIVDAGRIGLFTHYLSTDHFDCNDAFREIYGFPTSGVVYLSDLESRYPDDKLSGYRLERHRSRKIKNATQLHRKITLPNGSARQITLTVRSLQNDSGDTWAVVGSVVDDTDAHQRQVMLEDALCKQEEMLERQKELFAIIGHELRTPVAAINMLIADQDFSDGDKLHQISAISTNLLHVLEDLRVVVAPERALESHRTIDSPVLIIKRALDVLRPLVHQNGMRLTFELDAEYTAYEIHAQSLRQLVTNLVKNAAIHSGGDVVSVRLSYTPSDTIEDVIIANLTIADNGRGLPAHLKHKTYEAFQRGKTETDGSGLGLFIAQTFAKQMGTTLMYTDTAGGGATFTVQIPLEVGKAKTAAIQPMNVRDISFKNLHILCAEDEATIRLLTERSLEARGAVVKCVSNGEEALKAFQNDPTYNLILTDLMMPKMDGHELTRQIRKLNPDVTIIAVTAAVIGHETEQFYKDGANAVIPKPITPVAIYEILQKQKDKKCVVPNLE